MNVQMYGVTWCGDCRAARQFLEKYGIAYTEIDIDRDAEAAAEVIRQVGKRAVPQLVIDGEWFQPYTPGQGLRVDALHEKLQIPRS